MTNRAIIEVTGFSFITENDNQALIVPSTGEEYKFTVPNKYNVKTYELKALYADPIDLLLFQYNISIVDVVPTIVGSFTLPTSSTYGHMIWMESIFTSNLNEVEKFRFYIRSEPHSFTALPDIPTYANYVNPAELGGYSSRLIDPITKDYKVSQDNRFVGQDSNSSKIYMYLNTIKNSSAVTDFGLPDYRQSMITNQTLSEIKTILKKDLTNLNVGFNSLNVSNVGNRVYVKIFFNGKTNSTLSQEI